MLKIFVFIFCVVLVLVNSVAGTKKTENRQAKLFSFNVLDEDIRVELDFVVPFLRIPVKKSMDTNTAITTLPTININTASLALAGVVALGATVVLPFLAKQYVQEKKNVRHAKLIDNAEFSADTLLDLGQQMLGNSNGFGGCPLRLVCWAAQKNIAKPRAILSQIIDNKLLSSMVNSSAVEDAMISGLHGRSCSSYAPCPLKEHHVQMLLNNLVLLTNAHDIY